MKFTRLIFFCVLWSVLPVSANNLPEFSAGYSPDRDPFVDARAAIALAKRDDKRVLIKVGGDWCVWCHRLDSVIKSHPDSNRVLNAHYVVLKINVSEENDNARFMEGMPQVEGYPQLFVARADGKVIHVQDPNEFMQNGVYSAQKVNVFLNKWKGE